jgi:hypothetical protein
MKEIPLTLGKVALVSDCDYEFLMQWNWHFDGMYAARSENNKPRIRMHKVIADRAGLQGEIDHEDRNKLNNQRNNIRGGTHSQNMANMDIRQDNSSGFKGVSWSRERQKWIAQISCGRQVRRIGRFDTPIEAARAYDHAAERLFGEFACTNAKLGLL